MKRDATSTTLLIVGAILLVAVILLIVFAAGHWRISLVLGPPSPTPTPSQLPSPTPTFTPTATPSPTPSPTPLPEADFLWLARPIGPGGEQKVDRFYPYGSTAGGNHRIHHGVEFQNPEGTPALAVAWGTVVVAGRDDEVVYGAKPNFYGQLVVIELGKVHEGKKIYVLYGHLSKIEVQVGQEVVEGEKIGEVGMTGGAFGPHLHFEVRIGDNSYESSRNPEIWLRPLPGHGVIAGRLINSRGESISNVLITVHHKETPDQRWPDIYTYPAEEAAPDGIWQENFVIGDVPVGEYVLKASVDGKLYTDHLAVVDGEASFIVIQTE